MKLPAFLSHDFWDVDFDSLDTETKPHFIASRILEYGNIPAIQWLLAHVGREDIKMALRESRAISPRSAHFWSALFSVDEKNIRCLTTSSQKLQESHWSR